MFTPYFHINKKSQEAEQYKWTLTFIDRDVFITAVEGEQDFFLPPLYCFFFFPLQLKAGNQMSPALCG